MHQSREHNSHVKFNSEVSTKLSMSDVTLRHAILFLPVIHSFEETTLVALRTANGLSGVSSMLSTVYSSCTVGRALVEIGFLRVGGKFSFLPDGSSCHRWFPSLSSTVHSTAWNALSVPRADGHISAIVTLFQLVCFTWVPPFALRSFMFFTYDPWHRDW